MARQHPFHKTILASIKKYAGNGTRYSQDDRYLGNTNSKYAISVPALRKIARDWMVDHPELLHDDLSSLITSLVNAPSSTEKCFAGILLDYAKNQRIEMNPSSFSKWLAQVEGWAEVDALCYAHFTANEMLTRWKVWKKLIMQLAISTNINKRRASMVLLCKPLTQSDDKKLSALAFYVVNKLRHEQEILITKALSWILRSMVKHHKVKLQHFLLSHQHKLPAMVVRETKNKLTTGRKHT